MPSVLLRDEESKLHDEHEFESIGSILRRLRAGCEAHMTPHFNLPLSLMIDELVRQEEACCLLGEEGRP
jgi:hypothetical protein